MLLNEKEVLIPLISNHDELLYHISQKISEQISGNEMPVRFVITKTDKEGYHCELGILSGIDSSNKFSTKPIFDFQKRKYENTNQFNAVLLVPTGIGAEIGGHSGDSAPAARLLASVCDNLITHPNVVNASDLNEMSENTLYVEGSVITRLIMGTVGLQKVRSNRVLLIADKHFDGFFNDAVTNSVSAARSAFGLECPKVVVIEDNVLMRALFSNSGRAVGRVERFEALCEVLENHRSEYDAVALSSIINLPVEYHLDYFQHDSILNPWGGVEAMLTHALSTLYDIPSAHSPMMESREVLDLELGVVEPRKAAEAVSVTFLHCILKGLHKSPRIITDQSLMDRDGVLDISDVSCLVIPDGCVGLPTLAALEQGIPVIAVKENENRMENKLEDLPFKPGKLIVVDNYLEAVGVMSALKAGVSLESVRRPLEQTTVIEVRRTLDSKKDIKSKLPIS